MASEFTVGINGINSAGLELTGNGIPIGQVESGRPGKPMKDNAMWVHDQVQPFEVYAGTGVDTANSAHVTWTEETPDSQKYGRHATQVAGVMIGKKTPDASVQGVAPDAILYSGALNGASATDVDRRFAVTANRIATLSGDVRIINISAGMVLQDSLQKTDGNQHITQFIDWSARTHDVLYVIGGAENTALVDVPQDNFNGITVAASSRLGGGSTGPFMQAASFNSLVFDAEPGTRTTIDLLAPGTDIRLASQDTTIALADGTSYAAPHVTGTAALLQEHAENQIMDVGSPRWGANARRHEVMKAILLNSADKLAGVHGSIRDIVKSDGVTKWTDTSAFNFADTSLDEELGAGHLNAKSAFDNFAPGEYGPGTVPAIGWDYGSIGSFTTQEYTFDQEISGWVAMTLAWDRRVVKTSDGPYTSTDLFFT
jgi:subtilisin family serine protease